MADKKTHETKAEKSHEQQALSTNKLVIAGFACVISYAVLFALSAAKASIGSFISNLASISPATSPITSFFQIFIIPSLIESPMFFIMPLFAFFAMFLMVDEVKKGLEAKLPFGWLCLAIFAVFFVLALSAYYVALYWYLANYAQLSGVALTPDMVDFWGKLTNSAFLLFIWGGIFGIITRYAVEKIKI